MGAMKRRATERQHATDADRVRAFWRRYRAERAMSAARALARGMGKGAADPSTPAPWEDDSPATPPPARV